MKNKFSLSDRLLSLLFPSALQPALAQVGDARLPAGAGRRSGLMLFAAGGSGSDDRDEVDVTRRRATDAPGPEGRERAAAPSRRRESGQEAPPPVTPPSQPPSEPPSTLIRETGPSQPYAAGGTAASGGGGGIKLPLPVLLVGGLLVCCVGAFLVWALSRGGSGGPTELPAAVATQPAVVVASPTPVTIRPTATLPRAAATATSVAPAANATRAPGVTPAAAAASSSGQKWLIMLYQDATDRGLDQDIFLDLNEAERAGSTDNVKIVSQIKRYRGAGQAAGVWNTARRFYVTRDTELNTVRSQQVADLGQVNMADTKTLIDFVAWAVKTYPSDKYALILSDHGMGWPGGFSDPSMNGPARNIPLATKLGNMMFLNEIDQALGTLRTQTGIDKFELIGLDACLMSQAEVLDVLAPHARYAVLSEETEPSLGWAYTSFLETLQANPAMSGGDLAKAIVKTYIQDDQRIVDDQARAELVGNRGSPLDALFGTGPGAAPSAAEVANQMGQDVTLTAIDLQTFPAFMDSLNKLSHAMQKVDARAVAQARSYAQTYTSIFGEQVPPSYVDLGHFVQLLTRTSKDQALADAAQRFQAALKTTVIAEKHGAGKPGSTGISVYFPASALYKNPYAGPASYTAVASRFAKESQWDDFLAYFYTGRDFALTTNTIAVPASGVAVRAPVTSQIQVSAVRLSGKTVAPGKTVQLAVDIDGNNVGYIKLFAGFYDKASNSLNVMDQDYLQSDETREVSGVYYPVWPESGKYTVKFNWEPVVFAINDGKKSVPVLFKPETYGRSQEQAIYTVDGTYTFADGSGSRPARLIFRNKLLRQVLGFASTDFTGAPREITPQVGDTFTVFEQWMDLNQSGNVTQVATQKGETLTFGKQIFTWKTLDAAAGDYLVGYIIEDLDGNQKYAFDRVTVQ